MSWREELETERPGHPAMARSDREHADMAAKYWAGVRAVREFEDMHSADDARREREIARYAEQKRRRERQIRLGVTEMENRASAYALAFYMKERKQIG